MTHRKKLIEVALPLAKINEAAARENYIYRGNPSAIHKWWAQRPLAACRAVLFASLVDDPDSDPAYRRPDGSVDENRAGLKRKELFDLIEELVQWENSNNPRVINQARGEIARCVASWKIELGEMKKDTIIFGPRKGQTHPKGPLSGEGVTAWEVVTRNAGPDVVNAFLAEYAPPVFDPFCGGGSIPLEAQRLGLRAYASDLNPVAVLISKALIEIPPKFAGRSPVNPDWEKKKSDEKAMKAWHGAQGLAEDVRYYGKWMRDEAEKRLGHFYPKVKIDKEMAKHRPDLKELVGRELTVIAWLWARTVASPNPAAKGAFVPLVRSFWISTKKGKKIWLRPILDRQTHRFQFEIRNDAPPTNFDPAKGTIGRQGGRCLFTNEPIPLQHIRQEGRLGRLGCRLLALVAETPGGRLYLSPISEHEETGQKSEPHGAPNTSLPEQALGFRVQLYGMKMHRQLFSSRQLAALITLSDLIGVTRQRVFQDADVTGMFPDDSRVLAEGGLGSRAYADTVATYLAFAVDKVAIYGNTLVPWYAKEDRPSMLFGRQTISMVWDFAEVNPWSDIGGSATKSFQIISDCLSSVPVGIPGEVNQLDAASDARQDPYQGVMVCTDPPYYDNVPYADLADFFYVWLRRSLAAIYPQLLSTLLCPKTREMIADPFRFHGDRELACQFFEEGLKRSFIQMRNRQASSFPLTVFYAFKQTEEESREDEEDGSTNKIAASTGWETMLQGLISSGLMIIGTWPMRTERTGRLRDTGSNALASSIVLVCRSRPGDAQLATRKQFIMSLRQELPEALRNLQHGNIAPVDLAQASIGPGMAAFTRYAKVMETDGSAMTVRTALGLINQALDEVLAEQEGEFDGDTRWALAWFEQFGMDEGPFGVAETLSKAKNTAVNGLVEAGVVKARSGKVRLVKRSELPDDWDPTRNGRLTVWEATQHLIRALDQQGESGAATRLHQLGGLAETARDLAYRLYLLCERKKWAEEALAYNGLVIAWPELTKLALAERSRVPSTQAKMF